MFNFFSNKQEKKRKEAQELALRRSLKAKLARYEESALNPASDSTDFTEISLDGISVSIPENENY